MRIDKSRRSLAALTAGALLTALIAWSPAGASQSQGSSTASPPPAHNWTDGEIGDNSTDKTAGGTSITKSNAKGKVTWKYCPGQRTGRSAHGPHETISFSGGASGSVSGGLSGGGTTVSVSGEGEVTVEAPSGTTTLIKGNKSKVTVSGSGQIVVFQAESPKPHDCQVTCNGSGTIYLNGCPSDNTVTTMGGPWVILP